jgi:hypothetical protein
MLGGDFALKHIMVYSNINKYFESLLLLQIQERIFHTTVLYVPKSIGVGRAVAAKLRVRGLFPLGGKLKGEMHVK